MHQADALWVVVSLLAVWRVTHLLHAESGPWDVFGAVRRGASRIGAGAVFDCFYCLSLWVALPFAEPRCGSRSRAARFSRIV
jgi:hypothetical protein